MTASASPPPPASPGDERPGQRDEHQGQYVLPLVVRIERALPPARTDALETAARAVLTLLSDSRTTDGDGGDSDGGDSGGGGEWHKRVRLWEERGIRKVVRRARGAEWSRAEALPGVTVTGRAAEVRAFPPVPLDGWPRDLARLQVSGTDLADPEPPPPPAAGTPVLWLSPELRMSAGKAMAQAGHAAQYAWWELPAAARTAWREEGFPLAVRTADSSARWARLTRSGLPVVRDAGFTEIAPGSCTVVADHPGFSRA